MSHLCNFMSAYFHQDWTDEADNPDQVIENYLTAEPREYTVGSLEEIRRLLGERRADAELEQYLLVRLGCYYDPTADGVTVSQWLQIIADRLDRALRTAPPLDKAAGMDEPPNDWTAMAS
jgi:hypothetical protein